MRNAIIIFLIVASTAIAVRDVVRINNRRAQQQRIKTVRRPENRELRL